MVRPPHVTPVRIIELDETDSTQVEAQRRSGQGERGPLWISTARQTRGRGRSGREWISPTGNLAATLLFEPGCPAALLPQVSLVTGIAAFDAVAAHFDPAIGTPPLRLKWPNDLLIGNAKLAGILIECMLQGADIIAMAGVGINIVKAPEIEGRVLTCLSDHSDRPPAVSLLLRELAQRMQDWLQVWNKGAGFALIRSAWLARALPEGTAMMVNAGEGEVSGTFAGLDIDGALLLLEPSGHRRRFSWGDVTLPAPTV